MRFVLTTLLAVFAAGQLSAGSASATRTEGQRMVESFAAIVARVEPAAERECRARTKGMNCDFKIVLDKRPGMTPNAHQSLDETGRPIIRVTATLLNGLHNPHEVAFILAHEAGHHIGGHLARARKLTSLDRIEFATIKMPGLATPDPDARHHASVYARAYELEADGFGAIIALRAGFNPVKGAACLHRLFHSGTSRKASHPPHAERLDLVRKMVARYR